MKTYITFILLLCYTLSSLGYREKQCTIPEFRNGNAKIRHRNKNIRFQCKSTYTLHGNNFARCIGHKYDAPVPFCAKSGCTGQRRSNGFIATSSGQAILFCHQNFQIYGNRLAYCDGRKWDRELGECRETNQTLATSCDFETEDLCGWTHAPEDNFQWQRTLGVDIHKRLRTGPQHDHTTQQPYGGHYMLIESINQRPGTRARLFSPVYPAEYSVDACIKFYYHMYGPFVDTLRVYVKPVSVDLDEMLSNLQYLYFEINGNQKNMWKEDIFDIEEFEEEFQIIFEGVAGKTQLSDIAIDDVSLMKDGECINDQRNTKNPEVEEADGAYTFRSCKDRCDETTRAKGPEYTLTSNGQRIYNCDCYDGCVDNNQCCPDYDSTCFDSELFTTMRVATAEADATTYELPNIDTVSTNAPTTVTRKDETTNRPTQKVTVTQTEAFTPFIATVTPEPHILAVTTEQHHVIETSTSSENVVYPSTRAQIKSTTLKDTTVLEETTQVDWYPVTTQKPTNNNTTKETNWQASMKQSIDIATTTNGPSFVTILVVAISIVCLTLLTISLLVYYRRRYFTSNYKKQPDRLVRKGIVDSSEIRFLTSDEHLDFTLQTPDD